MEDTNKAYGWDEERIDNPNENDAFTLLPPGNYNFEVVKFERGRFDGSPKMAACPMAIYTLDIDGGELGIVKHTHRLFLNRKCDGINCSFFTSIGLRKHGDPLVLAWNDAVSRTGRLKLANREHDGKRYNDVKSFLNPEEVPASAAPPVDANQEVIPF